MLSYTDLYERHFWTVNGYRETKNTEKLKNTTLITADCDCPGTLSDSVWSVQRTAKCIYTKKRRHQSSPRSPVAHWSIVHPRESAVGLGRNYFYYCFFFFRGYYYYFFYHHLGRHYIRLQWYYNRFFALFCCYYYYSLILYYYYYCRRTLQSESDFSRNLGLNIPRHYMH